MVIFAAEFWNASVHGTLEGVGGGKLWVVARVLRGIRSNSISIEGFMSLMKAVIGKAPHIGLPLLSARCCIKKDLGLGARGAHTKWSNIRPTATAVLNESIANFSEIESVVGDDRRWAQPRPTQHLPTKEHVHQISNELSPSLAASVEWRWAVHYNSTIIKTLLPGKLRGSARMGVVFKALGASIGVDVVPDIALGDTIWFASDRNYSTGYLTKAIVRASDKPPALAAATLVGKLALPHEFLTSYAAIASFYDAVHGLDGALATEPVRVLALKCRLAWDVDVDDFLHCTLSDVGLICELGQRQPRPAKRRRSLEGGWDSVSESMSWERSEGNFTTSSSSVLGSPYK